MIEQLSGLPTSRFVRRPAASLSPPDAAALLAEHPEGRLFVLGSPTDLAPLRPTSRLLHENTGQALIEILRSTP
jgi:hypothetical protein